jgi:hypothetical protein
MAKRSKSGPPDGGGNPYDRALGGRAAQRPEGLQACIATLDQGPDALAKVLDAFIEANPSGRRYRFMGHAGIGRLVMATPVAKNLVTPAGFGRMWERQIHVRLRAWTPRS